MNARCRFVLPAALVAAVPLWATTTDAQRINYRSHIRSIASSVILPRSRAFAREGKAAIEAAGVQVCAVILHHAARMCLLMSPWTTSSCFTRGTRGFALHSGPLEVRRRKTADPRNVSE